MAKDKNKVAPADGALVKQGSAKRRNRKAWPGDEAAEDKSPKSGKRRDSTDEAGVGRAAGAAARRRPGRFRRRAGGAWRCRACKRGGARPGSGIEYVTMRLPGRVRPRRGGARAVVWASKVAFAVGAGAYVRGSAFVVAFYSMP